MPFSAPDLTPAARRRLARLPRLLDRRAQLDGEIVDLVRELRLVHGASWTQIAEAVGVSKQAARERWLSVEDER